MAPVMKAKSKTAAAAEKGKAKAKSKTKPKASAKAKPASKVKVGGKLASALKAKAKSTKKKGDAVGKAKAKASAKKKAGSEKAAPEPSPSKEALQSPKKGAAAGSAPAASPHGGVSRPEAEAVAKEVLRRSHLNDNAGVLRVLGDNIGADGAERNAAAVRKAFLRISMLIHPDKLPNCPEAKSAFQALVTAFDRLQQKAPEPSAALKRMAISRSNEGCHRTDVRCPRCKASWGSKSEGNPDYYYNFMMQGLRTFPCATCLCSFGCFTAEHICPHCKRLFEYHPEQYNHKVSCGYADCRKPFGFMLYHASENALKAAREQAQAEFAKRSRLEEASRGRASRAARRSSGPVDHAQVAETAFLLGLRDICPRCGLELMQLEDGAQMRHLRECTDTAAHKRHQEILKRKADAKAAADKKHQAQHSHASLSVWTFTGELIGRLWMLTDDQVKRRCKKEGLAITGNHAALVGRLADYCSERGDRDGPPSETLPPCIQTLTNAKLASVCAAHRLKGLTSREEMLEALEDLAASHTGMAIAGQRQALKDRPPTLLALKDGKPALKRAKKS
eukprot:TRINITY_DN42237_c0_g1_i1.p1 TRINITY_DN42237_c0_g1~~TRINITY_DN42237_c0_g1_i1.p1  ORF type:complete len:562 (+),score=161.94 TRINITY_DN42237_c0_g1_i1:107-1792(+)